MAPFLADHPVVSRHWRCRWVGWSAASNSVSWMLTWGWRELGCVLTPCSSSPQLWSAAFIFGNADLQMVKLVGIPLPEVHLVRVSDVGRNTHFYPLQLIYIPYYTAPTSFVENPFRWVIPSVIRTCQAEEGSYPDLPARAQGLDGAGAWLPAARGEALPLSCWPSWRLASSQTNTKAASWALWEHPYLCGMPISCSSPVTRRGGGEPGAPSDAAPIFTHSNLLCRFNKQFWLVGGAVPFPSPKHVTVHVSGVCGLRLQGMSEERPPAKAMRRGSTALPGQPPRVIM